ncbi:DUF1707 domain-containing protein [Sphaerisporangium sp. TRM90804]|uniref:DUF1707 SHOCT-like domain-containing protein n=1 Tax=Sphaerisporangium sp. TRM90804 TaxID=3031113 RepID=UPI00244A755F|nr:DUF1707 domain-containing protein [Sphaerisporangium sp. TRM90804]MDH2427456.1 DUF1707 domain-containing protein [Sphaerisporangium sp. TRM90804]
MTDVVGNVRASDDDREQAAERLRVAAGEGRISLDELNERLDATYRAKTYAELALVTSDLPGGLALSSTEEPLVLRSHSGSIQQVGEWVVPARLVAECGWGSLKIDFTRATCRHREVALDATLGGGGMTVIVPRGWTVRVENVTTGMGSVVNKADAPSVAGMPVLRVNGRVGMGTLKFKHPRR